MATDGPRPAVPFLVAGIVVLRRCLRVDAIVFGILADSIVRVARRFSGVGRVALH